MEPLFLRSNDTTGQSHISCPILTLGYNYRMTDLQGAIGEVQLKKLDSFIQEKSQMGRFL